jgi:hypothetical protein
MLLINHLPQFGLMLLTAYEPFSLMELEQQGRASAADDGDMDTLSLPMLFDFRCVNMMKYDSGDFQRIIARRQTFANRNPNNPAAFVVRDMDDYGMMRMYSAYAASYGLRDIERSFISENLGEAVSWMLGQTEGDPQGAPALLQEIARVSATGPACD